jgi:hypothetical protein
MIDDIGGPPRGPLRDALLDAIARRIDADAGIVWRTDWPDWGDCGKRVEVELHDGGRALGRLAADVWFTGEDEIPLFVIETEAGEVSFATMTRWREVNQ